MVIFTFSGTGFFFQQLGYISRINHALDKLPERLEGAQSQLENFHKQVEAAKLEIAEPFERETELEIKQPILDDCINREAMKKVENSTLTFEKTIQVIDDDNIIINTINYRYFNS